MVEFWRFVAHAMAGITIGSAIGFWVFFGGKVMESADIALLVLAGIVAAGILLAWLVHVYLTRK